MLKINKTDSGNIIQKIISRLSVDEALGPVSSTQLYFCFGIFVLLYSCTSCTLALASNGIISP